MKRFLNLKSSYGIQKIIWKRKRNGFEWSDRINSSAAFLLAKRNRSNGESLLILDRMGLYARVNTTNGWSQLKS